VASRRSRQFITAIVLVLAIAAGVIAWRATAGRGSTVRQRNGPVVAVGSLYPVSYLAVYQVNENDVHLWEVLSVQRPFAGSDLTYRTTGAPGRDARAISGSISTTTGLYAVTAQGVQLVSGRQPGPPSGDAYIGSEIVELVQRGLASDLFSTLTIAGRRCAVYRLARPPSGPVPSLPRAGDHDDLCLDNQGLVLAETWTYNGHVVLRRTAVDVRSSLQGAVANAAPPAPSTDGARPPSAAAATVVADEHPSTFIAPPPAPAGFQEQGPALDFRLPDPQSPAQSVATTIVWAFTEGAHVITVEAGRQRGGALPWHDGDTVARGVMLTGLGRATTAVRADGFELRIDLGGQWVRVHGTVSLDRLIAYGRLLTHAAAPTGA
jgi:hypothetical protein